jgi:exodeoxyribonuclease VII small subunit
VKESYVATSPTESLTFEQALQELERIVHDLEEGTIGLEESLTRYEQGIGLLKRCYGQLRDAEQRILLLTGVDEEGQPTLQPFQASATAETGRAEVRKSRKKPEEPRGSAY